MNFSSLLKQLKKRLRWKRRWISLGSIILLLLAYWLNASIGQEEPVVESTTSMTQSQYEQPTVQQPADEIIKEDTYFGLDELGILSLFEGPPSEKKVIRSFFQLDIEYLESSLPHEVVEQLYEGIQITDITEYNSVLSTFSDYAVEISNEVLKPFQ